jgi:DsbC/DsbD-like thiol-disulfide interchange protein
VGLGVLAGALAVSCVRGELARTSDVSEVPGRTPTSSFESPPVRFELISDVDRVQPGVMFRLGVLITVEPGWFVHWRHAGGSGQPTTLDLTMPYDFKAGPVSWPTPSGFTGPDGTTRYGYADSVLLTSDIRASNVDEDVYWPLRADVGVMACQSECIETSATLTLDLPHSISGTRLEHFEHLRLFEEWSELMPVPSDGPWKPFATNWTRSSGPTPRDVAHAIVLDWNDPPTAVEWFPSADTAAAFPKTSAETDDRRTRITLERGDQSPQGAARGMVPTRVSGVVGYLNQRGERRGTELSIELSIQTDP